MSGILKGVFGMTSNRETRAASAEITAPMARALLLRYARKVEKITVTLPGMDGEVGKFRNVASAGKTRLLDYHSTVTLDLLTARRYLTKILATTDGSNLTLVMIYRPLMGYNPVVSVFVTDFNSEDLVRYARMSEDELNQESEESPDQM